MFFFVVTVLFACFFSFIHDEYEMSNALANYLHNVIGARPLKIREYD